VILLTAAPATATDPISLLLNYGPVGLIGLLFAAGYIVAKPTHAAVIKERDDLKAALAAANAALVARQADLVPRVDYQVLHDDLAKLRAKMEDRVIPGMFQYGAALDRALQVLSRMAERAPV
jgi:hypothetical protein